MKKTLIQKLGLLGVVSFLSYMAAVLFAPLAYPGYDWMAQAVSDLSAANAPSLALWNQLSSLYNACELPCVMMVCVGIQGQKKQAAARRHLPVRRHGVGVRRGVPHVPSQRQRLCRSMAGSDASYHHGAGGGAVHYVAVGDHHRRSEGTQLSLLRRLCRDRTGHDAGGRIGDVAGSHGVFRRGGTVQCICRHRLQRGAGSAPVF